MSIAWFSQYIITKNSDSVEVNTYTAYTHDQCTVSIARKPTTLLSSIYPYHSIKMQDINHY